MDPLPAPAAPARLRPETLVALAFCAAAALWVDLGLELHRDESGDSMLMVLISLQKWTPFYWEQDRFGMLLPLLMKPLRDPVMNLLVQRGICFFAAQCTTLVAARWAFGAERWQLPGALALALWHWLAPASKTAFYMSHFHPFAQSMLFGLGALVLLESGGRRAWRWPAAAALMLLGHWVNVVMCAFLVPAALARAAAVAVGTSGDARRAAYFRGLREAGLSLGAGVAIALLSQLTTEGSRSVALRFLSAAEWAAGLGTLWEALVREWAPGWLAWTCLAVAAAGAVAMAASRRWRQEAREPARIGLGLLLAALAYSLLVVTQNHVQLNGFASRYVEPALALVQLSLLAPFAVPVARALSGPAFRAACALLSLLAAVGAAVTFGPPQPGKIRETLMAVSPLTPEVISRRCTHVAGNYWKVWPAVMMANAELYRRGEDRQVWGISHRSVPTLPLSTAVPASQVRIAVALDDREWAGWVQYYSFYGHPPNLVLLERGEKIAVLGLAQGR